MYTSEDYSNIKGSIYKKNKQGYKPTPPNRARNCSKETDCENFASEFIDCLDIEEEIKVDVSTLNRSINLKSVAVLKSKFSMKANNKTSFRKKRERSKNCSEISFDDESLNVNFEELELASNQKITDRSHVRPLVIKDARNVLLQYC